MEEVVHRTKCTGCSACANKCPQNAIMMKENIEGFIEPVIDENKCINCGICKRICPVLNTKKNDSVNECYIAFAKQEDMWKEASSGGLFPAMANYVLNENGIVIGAAFDKNNELRHIAVTNKEELYKLKGSKYIQSDLGNIFKYIKDNVENKKVLFVGVPCQVAGLKAYLNKEYENLICIDLICHGVPSPNLFKKYIEELEKEKNDELLSYNFRDKITGWDMYSNTAIFRNSNVISIYSKNDYMRLFLADVALRESCFNCNFKLGNKYSDITLGDFWGVNKYYPEMYNRNGVSAVIVNTNKGKYVFDRIKEDLEYKSCNIKEIIDGNLALKVSSHRPESRNLFFDDLYKKNIRYLVKKYAKKDSLFYRLKRKIKKMIG